MIVSVHHTNDCLCCVRVDLEGIYKIIRFDCKLCKIQKCENLVIEETLLLQELLFLSTFLNDML